MTFKIFKRQNSGSCICVFCNRLISVNQATCPNCSSKNPTLWGYSRSLRRLGSDLGFTTIVTSGCMALYLGTLLTDLGNISSGGEFDFLAPSQQSLMMFGAAGAIPVFKYGHWWTLLSAGWLHSGFLHIAFNLSWVHYLAPKVAKAFGSGRLVTIYTVAIVIGFLLSSLVKHSFPWLPEPLQGSDWAIGASGGVFGLLGALVAYAQITGNFRDRNEALTHTVVGFLYGLILSASSLQRVDNWGHLGGFLGGYLISWIGGLNPRYREGLRHLFLAVICLGLTVLSILASIVYGIVDLLPLRSLFFL